MRGKVYLKNRQAAALYSYATGKVINDKLTVSDMEWAIKNRQGFSIFGCKTFGDFVSLNNIQIVDDCSGDCRNCRCKKIN